MIRFLILLSLSLGATSACKAKKVAPIHPTADSSGITVAISQEAVTLDKDKTYVLIPLKIIEPSLLSSNHRYRLFFDSLVIHAFAEGVYEIHLSTSAQDSIPTDISFVNVLDLYANIRKSIPSTVSLYTSNQISRILTRTKNLDNKLFILLYFRGNKLPSGTVVQHKGKLTLGKVRLVISP